jgi:hypothetical protein
LLPIMCWLSPFRDLLFRDSLPPGIYACKEQFFNTLVPF